MNRQIARKRSGAFSLLEVLVVITVLGVISTLSVAGISRVRSSAREVSAKRNAQEAASLSAVADAAGVVHVLPELAGGVEATLAVLAGGITGMSETGIPMYLRLDLSENEIEEAARFLSLRYTSTGIIMEYHNLPLQHGD